METPASKPMAPWYPSKEEAEYPAHLCFTLVVAASHWAAQQGFAALKTQRLPPMQCAGDWRPLLKLDCRVSRDWPLPAVAAFLGLPAFRRVPCERTCSTSVVPFKRSPIRCRVYRSWPFLSQTAGLWNARFE